MGSIHCAIRARRTRAGPDSRFPTSGSTTARETVTYVSNIDKYYIAYCLVLESQVKGSTNWNGD
jgi:hypothetical protein